MLLSWILLSVVSSLTAVKAQLNVLEIEAQLPTCTLVCSLDKLAAANCPLTDVQNCLCTNTTLQNDIFECVYASCNITEQYNSAVVLQNSICHGVPFPSRSGEIIRVVTVISALTFPILILRLISRYVVGRIWYDDWIVVVGGILMIPMTVIPILNATKGFGTHAWDVPPQNQILMRQMYYGSQLLYVLVQNMAKISILLTYLRIFPNKHFRLVTQLSIAWVSLRVFAYLPAVILQCVPVRSLWQLNVPAKCVDSSAMVFSGAAFSILEDFFIMVLPIPELRRLSLSVKKTCGLVFLFALGSFACITSMIRLKCLVKFSTHAIDASWANVDVVIWSIMETYVAMICASIISIRPLLMKYFPIIFGTSASNSSLKPTSKFAAPAAVTSWHSRCVGLLGLGRGGVELNSRENVNEGGGSSVAEIGVGGEIKMTRHFEVKEIHMEEGYRPRR